MNDIRNVFEKQYELLDEIQRHKVYSIFIALIASMHIPLALEELFRITTNYTEEMLKQINELKEYK